MDKFSFIFVIPAKAGIQMTGFGACDPWVLAFAGTTSVVSKNP